MKLTPEQLETVLFALADGRDYRIGRLGDCDDLEQGTACEAHKDDLEKSNEYQALGELLSGQAAQ